jgi:hypothetical protein
MIRILLIGAAMLVALPTRAGNDPGVGLPECPVNQPTTFRCYNRGWQLPEEPRVGHRIPECVVRAVPSTADPIDKCIDMGTEVWPPDATHPYCRDRRDPRVHLPCQGNEQSPH